MHKEQLLSALVICLGLTACSNDKQPQEIESDSRAGIAAFIGEPATAKPIDWEGVPEHPFMAAQGRNGMHADAYNSDVHPYPAPLGNNPEIKTRKGTAKPGGQCATLTFNSEGNLVALCAAVTGFQLHLIEPKNLTLLADYELPMRPSTIAAAVNFDKSKIMDDSSGAYFYLDENDNVVMADSEQVIRRIGYKQDAKGQWQFYDIDRWDLSETVPHDCTTWTNWEPKGECDPITAVMPDHQGLIWWVSRFGRVGTLNTETGQIQQTRFNGEEIQNGFAVSADGVYILSDHAMYRMHAKGDGKPQIDWRESYDRGSKRKVGSINQGSGTTPTMFGEQYITFTDNADGRINLVVLKRQEKDPAKRQVCKIPVFKPGHSATDNSMVAFGRSIFLENNAGYTYSREQKDWENAGGGFVRIDVREDESGCDIVWESAIASPSVVPKISSENGLLYIYNYQFQGDGRVAWYFTALDIATGKTQYQVLTGVGQNFDNNWSPITLSPDGSAYVGTGKGLVQIKDR